VQYNSAQGSALGHKQRNCRPERTA